MKKKKYCIDCEQEFKEGENRRFKRCSECREAEREYRAELAMGDATDTLGLGIPDTDEWEYFHRDLEDMG